jgi:hypothetical protein
MIKAATFGRNGKAFVLSLPTNQPQNPLAPVFLKDYKRRAKLKRGVVAAEVEFLKTPWGLNEL